MAENQPKTGGQQNPQKPQQNPQPAPGKQGGMGERRAPPDPAREQPGWRQGSEKPGENRPGQGQTDPPRKGGMQ